mgnify:FL=1
MVDTKYVISIPLDDEPGEDMELGFPGLENMFGFLEHMMESGVDISRFVLPEGSLV